MKVLRKVLLLLAVVLVAIQFVPAELSNPPVTRTVEGPPEVLAILRRACFDCHSNETVWPWYARIAPVKFLLAHDVEEAREHLNLSTWDSYDAASALHHKEEMWEEASEGEMPLWYYSLLHSTAKLDEADLALLRAWAVGTKASNGPAGTNDEG